VEEYTEVHHIVPRCMGGTNHKDNLVRLTAREHFVAHQLLIKIYPKNRKLIFAAAMMSLSSGRLKRSSNRLYERLKKLRAKAMSELHKGKTVSEETRQKLREKNKNYRPTPEAIEKSRLAATGRVCSASTRTKISAAAIGHSRNKGKKLSEDHKKKISESRIGKPLSEETKEKLSKINKGKQRSDATKEKISAAHKNRIFTEEHRKKISEAKKGKSTHYWITNGFDNCLLNKNQPIPEGWRRGRTLPLRGKKE